MSPARRCIRVLPSAPADFEAILPLGRPRKKIVLRAGNSISPSKTTKSCQNCGQPLHSERGTACGARKVLPEKICMVKGRRDWLTLFGGAALTTAALGCRRTKEMSEETKSPVSPKESGTRLPTIFVPHGGGPWPFVKIPGMDGKMESLREYLVSLPRALPSEPKALLVVSAHWEEKVPTVQSAAAPPMLYDYSGFPPRILRDHLAGARSSRARAEH